MPSGLLPVLELDGRIITESNVIMATLEETFPEAKPLLPPAGTPEHIRANQLMRLERRAFSDWLGWLTTDYNHARAKAQFESTMDVVAEQLEAAGGPYFLVRVPPCCVLAWLRRQRNAGVAAEPLRQCSSNIGAFCRSACVC